jgi:hypothetical protein
MRHRIKSSAMRTKEAAAFRDWPCKRHIGCLHVKASMHLKEYYFQRYAGRASQPLPQPLVIISIMTLRSSLTCARARNECHKRFFFCLPDSLPPRTRIECATLSRKDPAQVGFPKCIVSERNRDASPRREAKINCRKRDRWPAFPQGQIKPAQSAGPDKVAQTDPKQFSVTRFCSTSFGQ